MFFLNWNLLFDGALIVYSCKTKSQILQFIGNEAELILETAMHCINVQNVLKRWIE